MESQESSLTVSGRADARTANLAVATVPR